MSPEVSVIIPVYNEADTVGEIVERLLAVGFDKEIIIVDDGSTDDSPTVLRKLTQTYPDTLRLVTCETNRGKGAALRAGFAHASGQFILVQDADLEYDPEDIPKLLAALEQTDADVVYGSRIRGRTPRGYAAFTLGGITVSLVASLLFRTHLSDEPCCYKLFPRGLLDEIDLVCEGFEFCAELTARTLRRGYTLREVPVNYHPRSFREGKKIRWIDGVWAIYYLMRYRLAD